MRRGLQRGLRPSVVRLYDESATPEDTVDPVDAARGKEYALLAALLSSSPPQALLDQIARQFRADEFARG